MSDAFEQKRIPLQLWRFSGHAGRFGWWIVFIDHQKFAGMQYSQMTLAIVSDWGSWSYRWSGIPESGPLAFLRQCDHGYLGSKLLQDDASVYDKEDTLVRLRSTILEDRRQSLLSKEHARRDWDNLSMVEDEDSDYGFRLFAETSHLQDTLECYSTKKVSGDALKQFLSDAWPGVIAAFDNPQVYFEGK